MNKKIVAQLSPVTVTLQDSPEYDTAVFSKTQHHNQWQFFAPDNHASELIEIPNETWKQTFGSAKPQMFRSLDKVKQNDKIVFETQNLYPYQHSFYHVVKAVAGMDATPSEFCDYNQVLFLGVRFRAMEPVLEYVKDHMWGDLDACASCHHIYLALEGMSEHGYMSDSSLLNNIVQQLGDYFETREDMITDWITADKGSKASVSLESYIDAVLKVPKETVMVTYNHGNLDIQSIGQRTKLRFPGAKFGADYSVLSLTTPEEPESLQRLISLALEDLYLDVHPGANVASLYEVLPISKDLVAMLVNLCNTTEDEANMLLSACKGDVELNFSGATLDFTKIQIPDFLCAIGLDLSRSNITISGLNHLLSQISSDDREVRLDLSYCKNLVGRDIELPSNVIFSSLNLDYSGLVPRNLKRLVKGCGGMYASLSMKGLPFIGPELFSFNHPVRFYNVDAAHSGLLYPAFCDLAKHCQRGAHVDISSTPAAYKVSESDVSNTFRALSLVV